MCWEKVREGGEEEEVTCCRRVSSNQKQSVQQDNTQLNTHIAIWTQFIEYWLL